METVSKNWSFESTVCLLHGRSCYLHHHLSKTQGMISPDPLCLHPFQWRDHCRTLISTKKHLEQPGTDPDLHLKIRKMCQEMSSESAKALKELSSSIRAMIVPSSASRLASTVVASVGKLEDVLSEDKAMSDVLHLATIASLLTQLVVRAREIAGSVEELARLAHFKRFDPIHEVRVKP
ncbi:hypothetical protein GW17_00049848 [Ensete ventricosum]|nr:hypothetical protein GW17_00049848 [Ensete ventricosum]